MVGQTISHYKVLEKLGEGGMGIVYKAEDTKLKRTVALKFLSPELTSDRIAKERFFIEARAAAALNHANIITVFEIDEYDNQTFIAMEYVKGESLAAKIASAPLKTDDVISIAIQTAEGLLEAHEKGIIHRDIKSDNIMIDERGRVKIMDFGLARLKGQAQLTKPGTTMGTIAYMPPEQFRGEKIDHRMDIWSLGIVLYEMVTGQLPFKDNYAQAVIYTIMNEDPKPMTGPRDETAEILEQLVKKALKKNRDERYPQVNDLLGDLKRIQGGFDTEVIEILPEEEPVPSIAVLPFVDMSPGKDQEYFCDGMAEELINAFVKIEGLQVASRTSAFQFKEKGCDISEVGKKLKVQTVLEGSVRKAGNKLRITAQLINASDGYHIWSDKYDRDADDIFSIQDEISLAIVENLKVTLLGDEKEKLVKRYTKNEEAYNLYLKGLYSWNRRHEGGMKTALDYFQQAIECDPRYALPYVGIADCFNIMGFYGVLPAKQAFPRARQAAEKALEIDGTLGEAYASLGWISTMYDWDWIAGEREFQKAIALNPNYATAHEWYALYLTAMGRFDDAITEVRKAQALDPLSLIINATVGSILWLAHRNDKAVEQFQKTLEMDPDFQLALLYLGCTYGSAGRYEEAIVPLQKAVQLPGGMLYAAGVLGNFYAVSGQKEKALEIIDHVNDLLGKGYSLLLQKAYIYSGLGEIDRAFELLEKALTERESQLVFCQSIPLFDILRGDSRFNDLLKRIGIFHVGVGR
ncbi:MAG: protein kinase [bacterium]|nr:protein kinase [bacterium]